MAFMKEDGDKTLIIPDGEIEEKAVNLSRSLSHFPKDWKIEKNKDSEYLIVFDSNSDLKYDLKRKIEKHQIIDYENLGPVFKGTNMDDIMERGKQKVKYMNVINDLLEFCEDRMNESDSKVEKECYQMIINFTQKTVERTKRNPMFLASKDKLRMIGRNNITGDMWIEGEYNDNNPKEVVEIAEEKKSKAKETVEDDDVKITFFVCDENGIFLA